MGASLMSSRTMMIKGETNSDFTRRNVSFGGEEES